MFEVDTWQYKMPLTDPNRRGSMNWDKLRKKSGEKIRLIKGKYLCIVTGAGNGLGRAVANLVYQDGGIFPTAMAGSKLVLLDKDMESLRETSGKKMKQFLKHRKIEVDIICADLGDLNETKNTIKDILDKNDKDFEHVTLISHANTLGNASICLTEQSDYAALQEYFDLNIISKVFLVSAVCNGFPRSKKTIVFTANKYAVQGLPYLGISAMAESATKTYAQVFAKENPSTRVLYFTAREMESNKAQLLLNSCGNKDLKEDTKTELELQKLQPPLDVAKKLMKILEEYRFKSGEILVWPEHEENNNN